MPSFTRRAPPTTAPPPPGTVPSPSTTHPLFPSGVPSVDDLLGGGLPLGGSLAILSPDTHSAWGRLMARYFVAQGLASGQDCVVVGDEELGKDMVRGCPWLEEQVQAGESSSSVVRGIGAGPGAGAGSESEGEGELGAVGQGRGGQRIAWRYDALGKFKTTTGRSSNLNLMKVIPPPLVKEYEQDGTITYVSIPDEGPSRPATVILRDLQATLDKKGKGKATRVVITELGSADWGDCTSKDIHRFLHSLRYLLRSSSTSASAIITLSPSLISSPPPDWSSDQRAWLKSLSWAVDACIEMRGFADDPILGPHYAPLHGLLTLHSYPTSHALLPPTLRHSTLLGVSQSATNDRGGGGAGENNLGFRVKRKGLVVETAHLGIEGGSGERRTTAGDVGQVLDTGAGTGGGHVHNYSHSAGGAAGATVGGGVTAEAGGTAGASEGVDTPDTSTTKPKKAKKSVRVQFDDGSLDF